MSKTDFPLPEPTGPQGRRAKKAKRQSLPIIATKRKNTLIPIQPVPQFRGSSASENEGRNSSDGNERKRGTRGLNTLHCRMDTNHCRYSAEWTLQPRHHSESTLSVGEISSSVKAHTQPLVHPKSQQGRQCQQQCQHTPSRQYTQKVDRGASVSSSARWQRCCHLATSDPNYAIHKARVSDNYFKYERDYLFLYPLCLFIEWFLRDDNSCPIHRRLSL